MNDVKTPKTCRSQHGFFIMTCRGFGRVWPKVWGVRRFVLRSSRGFSWTTPIFRRMRFSKNPLFRVGPFYGCFLFVHGKRYFSVSRHPMISWNNQNFRIQFVFFCGGRRGKILPCVFPDWGLLVWKYFSVEFFPFRRNASLLAKKSEGGGVKRSPNCGLFGRV